MTGETEASFQCLLAWTTLFTRDFFHLHDASSIWDGVHPVAGRTFACVYSARLESAAGCRCLLQCSLFMTGHQHCHAAWAAPCQPGQPPGGCRRSCLRKALLKGPTSVYHLRTKEVLCLLVARESLLVLQVS